MSIILVVDDEKSIRRTFEAFLNRDGYEVLTAENVEIALEIIQSSAIDLVITDIIMPRITGIELLQIIKKENPDIPIITMTGEPTVETATLAVKSSAFDYLTKPVSKDVLLKAVKYALDHKELLDSKKKLEAQNQEYRKNLERLVEARTKSLQDAMHATIYTMSSLLELRDPYTAGHERKVGNLAVAIAKKMRLTKRQIDCIYFTGYLHDIGKIAIPAEILSKPGILNDIEFEIVKVHVNYGYNILKKANLPWPVAEVVYQHHERINGSGYPLGIKSDEIMMEAKIIAVADVIEAMTSHRPYRPGLGLKVALKEIVKNAGILYDTAVVEVVLDLINNDNYKILDEPIEFKFHL